jgi:glycosyltransferase involved in cell wall biosynthesis
MMTNLSRGPRTSSSLAPSADLPTPERAGLELSCVVLSVDAQRHLPDAVASLLAQDAPCEIVVVNSGEQHPATVLGPLAARVHIIHHGGRLMPGAARNLGIAAATAPVIAFLAADCLAEPGWVSGRLAAHRQGRAASSAVGNATPGRLAALASYLLLFSRRMPGTDDRAWQHYGVSYARELFAEYGWFDEDLRGGEDTEFHRRFADRVPIHRGVGIRTLHRHPERVQALLHDQYRRGRRAVRAFRGIGDPVRARQLPAEVLVRAFASFARFWRASTTVDRARAIAALPLIAGGAGAYALGAVVAQREPEQPTTPTPARAEVHVLLQVRDGMRFLPGYLDNLADKVAGVIALDDGSTDGSREYLDQHPLVVRLLSRPPRAHHVWNEPANRAALVGAATELGATWVLALDADERLPEDFLERVAATLARAAAAGIGAFYVWLRELWDAPDEYRVDGIWGSKRVARLFDVRLGGRQDARDFHGHWAPLDASTDGAFVQADLEIFHLSMIHAADRADRQRKYERLDPALHWQPIGYRYLTDARGLVCRRIPARASYRPLAAGAELDPRPPGLIALLPFHNEARFLPGYLADVAPHVDGIIALDDGSTDGGAALLQAHPKLIELLCNPARSPHNWNEPENQRRLIAAALRHGADWLVVVDADERVERDFRKRANAAIRLAERAGIDALSVKIRELWDSADTYRCDGLWAAKRKASLFRCRADHEFDPRPMHNYWAPLNSRVDGQFAPADLELYHLRMLTAEDRAQRHDRYRRLDPQSAWQPKGYDYLVDETGLALAKPVPHRHFSVPETDAKRSGEACGQRQAPAGPGLAPSRVQPEVRRAV